jgi:hypothetical protein
MSDEEQMREMMRMMARDGDESETVNRPRHYKDGTPNQETKSAGEYSRDAVLYKKMIAMHKNHTHRIGWVLYFIAILALVVGMGLIGGMWDSIPESQQNSEFKKYVIGGLIALGVGIVFTTVVVIWFSHEMTTYNKTHDKVFENIFKKERS